MGSPLFAIDPQEIILGLCGAEWNPTKDENVESMREHWRELVGVLPMFFWEAANAEGRKYITTSDKLLEYIADGMDNAYGFGGFSVSTFNKRGWIDPAGLYYSGYGDHPMPPIVKLQANDVECFIYERGIVSIRHSRFSLNQAKIARFD